MGYQSWRWQLKLLCYNTGPIFLFLKVFWSLFSVFKDWLFKSHWKSETEIVGERDPSFIHWLTPQMLAKGGTEPVHSHETEAYFRSSTWYAGAQVLEPYSATLSGTPVGTWIGTRTYKTKTSAHMEKQQLGVILPTKTVLTLMSFLYRQKFHPYFI